MNTIESTLCGSGTTLAVEGHGRRYDYRIERVDSDGSSISSWFVRVMMPHGWQYVGQYQPLNGWVTLTRASRLEPGSEFVRCIRWVIGRIWADSPDDIIDAGFTLTVTPD